MNPVTHVLAWFRPRIPRRMTDTPEGRRIAAAISEQRRKHGPTRHLERELYELTHAALRVKP